MAGFNLGDIPLSVQQELYEKLEKKFGSLDKSRDSSHMAREDKLKATADVLRSLAGFTLAQQRGILIFAISIIEDTQHRFWRDKNQKAKKLTNKLTKG